VRRTVGFARYDTEEEVDILNQIYDVLRLYVNMFQPVAKLISKERQGAKVKKIYDTPKTPCQRLLESPDIPEEVKAQLQKAFDELNPAALKREIDRLLRSLAKAYFQKKERLEQTDRELIFTYNFI
jgi:ABC-type phosphate/phosphonate transport system substrate-binding protein